jgi:hypothetical protein
MLVKPCRESMLFPDLRTPNFRHTEQLLLL